MYDFLYHRPKSLGEAARLLGTSSEGVLLAGGMTLIPVLKQRLASPSDVIDLGGIADLEGVSRDAATLLLGASAKHATVASDAAVRGSIPALAALAGMIGDPQVRNRGTLGGAVANNDPAADYPAALLGLGATINTTRRRIAADQFFAGMFETALEDDEIITSVRFPVPDKASYAKFPNPASRYALVGVFVSQGPAGTRVAVTGAGACVFRATKMERALSVDFSPGSLDGVTVAAEGLNSDIHASAAYRAHLLRVMAKRAVAACGCVAAMR
jgi:carbon-monoxide dehydrogenase medium subunit